MSDLRGVNHLQRAAGWRDIYVSKKSYLQLNGEAIVFSA
jgi:hypothetical protein